MTSPHKYLNQERDSGVHINESAQNRLQVVEELLVVKQLVYTVLTECNRVQVGGGLQYCRPGMSIKN